MNHLLVFSVHTSQCVLAYPPPPASMLGGIHYPPPPPIQCWFELWCARLTSPNIEWGGGNGSLPTLKRGGGRHILHIYNQVVWYFSKQGTTHIGFVHCLQIIFVFACLIAGYCKQCSCISFHLGFGQDNAVATVNSIAV